MAARIQVCRVGTGGDAKYFRGSVAMYTSATESTFGVFPAPDVGKSQPLYDTAELMRAGILQPISVRCQTGAGKQVTYRVLTAQTNTLTAIAALNDKTLAQLNGNAVISANIARRRVMK